MVEYRNLISSGKSFDDKTNMANTFASTDQSAHPKQTHQPHRNKRQPACLNSLKSTPCDHSRSAVVDVMILIAVLCACGVLLVPYVVMFYQGVARIGGLIISVVTDEFAEAPIIYTFLGFSFLVAMIAVWGVFHFTTRKCDDPNCRGLHKAAEFDIQLETEKCVKNLTPPILKVDTGFELAEARHQELEAELKKMAPPNGRAILVFRARCGCAVGRIEVWGPKRIRKIKK